MKNDLSIKLINEIEELLKQSAKHRAIQINTEKKIKEKLDTYKQIVLKS